MTSSTTFTTGCAHTPSQAPQHCAAHHTGPIRVTESFSYAGAQLINHSSQTQMDVKDGHSAERGRFYAVSSKPPGPTSKKLIHRSASSDAIMSHYMTAGECAKPDVQFAIKPWLLKPSQDSVASPLLCCQKSVSPGATARSQTNLWHLGSFLKKRGGMLGFNRASFKKLSQGSTEGLNQELENLTLSSEDSQQKFQQMVPDGHRAPIQELLDMFSDSPPICSSLSVDGCCAKAPLTHVPLSLTLSSSSTSSPPPPLQVGEATDDRHPPQQRPRHQHPFLQLSQQQSRSPFGSPEMLATFSLGSEVKQVKPLRSSDVRRPGDECEEEEENVMNLAKSEIARDSATTATFPQTVRQALVSEPLPRLSSHSRSPPPTFHPSWLQPFLPFPLNSPANVRASIPSNGSAFATYPTLPRSFRIKESPCRDDSSSQSGTAMGEAAASSFDMGKGLAAGSV